MAPPNAQRLMWHTDRGWACVSEWWKAVIVTVRYLRSLLNGDHGNPEWNGPGLLWLYLAFSSLVFYAAVPLAGLSLDPQDSLRLGTRSIIILGSNQSNFDNQVSIGIAEKAAARWQQGNPTTPQGSTIFYAPEDISSASNTFYDDEIQHIYEQQLETPQPHHLVLFWAAKLVREPMVTLGV